MNNEKIAAVVVTYNRKQLLKKCLQSLLEQNHPLDSIIIIDNASTDRTNEMINNEYKKFSVIDYVKFENNLGGAGGFHYGIKKAYEKDFDWIWLMDDDCISQNDTLEQLFKANEYLKSFNEDIGFLASNVFWIDGSLCKMNIGEIKKNNNQYKYLSKGILPLENASFVSMLIPKNTVKRIGLPYKEFFIWLDDYEYSLRITRKMKGFLVGYSNVFHETKKNEGVDYSKFKQEELWKYKIELRNYIFMIKIGRFGKFKIFLLLHRFKKLFLSKNIRFLPILLLWALKGIFFQPKLDKPNIDGIN